jgi:hypothetical protein
MEGPDLCYAKLERRRSETSLGGGAGEEQPHSKYVAALYDADSP